MSRILYDTTDARYKNPFGALPTGRSCTFSVAIQKAEKPETVQLCWRPDGSDVTVYENMTYTDEDAHYLRYSCRLAFEESGLFFYRFQFSCPEGVRFVGKKGGVACIGDWLSEWQLTVYDNRFQTPAWAKGAVMYQIFPDRFCRNAHSMPQKAKNERKIHENWFDVPDFIYDNPDYKGNDFFCGNLRGICDRLSYLQDLGVDVLYLNPVFESPENHRYSTGDYENIDPYLGTNEDFAMLCAEAKKHGMRVVLDGVFSHTGADSIYFNKYGHYDSVGAYQGEHSPYYHWYSFHDSGAGYDCWWGFENLPNVKETEPDYVQFITGEGGVLEKWQNCGASGWRLDVADELPDAFLDALRARVKQTDPDALIIGEVWEDATNKVAYGERRRYLLGEQLDSVMNYPWREAILDFLKGGTAEVFRQRIYSILENYPEPAVCCLMNVLSTHDTERIINALGVKREVPHADAAKFQMTEEEYQRGTKGLKQAAFLQFALPGIPSIYYGDEVGLTGFRDPYCRMCYPYGQEDAALLSYFKGLGRLRKDFREDFAAPLERFVAQTRTVAFCRGRLLFVLNAGNCDEIVKIKENFVTIFGSEKIKSKEEGVLIPARAFGVLRKKS